MRKSPEEVLETVIKSADDRQAEDLVALDVRGISILSDYFVIMNGTSSRQIRAIMNGIITDSEKEGITVKRVEGADSENWILIDLVDVIVHIFSEDNREFYDLEKLWSDAEILDVSSYVNES